MSNILNNTNIVQDEAIIELLKNSKVKTKKSSKVGKFLAIGVTLAATVVIAFPFVSLNHGVYSDSSLKESIDILAVDFTNQGLIKSTPEARELAFNNRFKHNQTATGSNIFTGSENEVGKKNREEVTAILKDKNVFEDSVKFQAVYKNLEDNAANKDKSASADLDVRNLSFKTGNKAKKVEKEDHKLDDKKIGKFPEGTVNVAKLRSKIKEMRTKYSSPKVDKLINDNISKLGKN